MPKMKLTAKGGSIRLTAKERKAGVDLRDVLAEREAAVRRERSARGAFRSPKLTRYEVTIRREIEHVAIIEVEAESADVARQMAEAEADEPNSRHWREGDVTSASIKVRAL